MRLRTQITLVFLCGSAFVSYALLARDVLHGRADEMSLAVSVRREAGATEMVGAGGPCRPAAPDELKPRAKGFLDAGQLVPDEIASGVWICVAGDARASGTATYRVRMRSGSCWEGRLATDLSGRSWLPHTISGCVHRWQWSLLGCCSRRARQSSSPAMFASAERLSVTPNPTG